MRAAIDGRVHFFYGQTEGAEFFGGACGWDFEIWPVGRREDAF